MESDVTKGESVFFDNNSLSQTVWISVPHGTQEFIYTSSSSTIRILANLLSHHKPISRSQTFDRRRWDLLLKWWTTIQLQLNTLHWVGNGDLSIIGVCDLSEHGIINNLRIYNNLCVYELWNQMISRPSTTTCFSKSTRLETHKLNFGMIYNYHPSLISFGRIGSKRKL